MWGREKRRRPASCDFSSAPTAPEPADQSCRRSGSGGGRGRKGPGTACLAGTRRDWLHSPWGAVQTPCPGSWGQLDGEGLEGARQGRDSGPNASHVGWSQRDALERESHLRCPDFLGSLASLLLFPSESGEGSSWPGVSGTQTPATGRDLKRVAGAGS